MKHETRAASGGDVEVVEQPGGHRLGHEQIGLVVGAGQHLAGLGERPSVEVAPRLEEAQDTIELAGQRAGAALHLARRSSSSRATRSAWIGAAHVGIPVRAVGDGVGLGGEEGVVDGSVASVDPRHRGG